MECKVGKEAIGYYTFTTKRNHCIAIPQSNVHSWKQKFVLVTSTTFVERIQSKEVTLEPKPEVLECLNSRDKSLYESFKSSGKRPDLSWNLLIQLETLEEQGIATVKHLTMEEIFGSVADLYGLSAVEARKAILREEQKVEAELSTTAGNATMLVPAGPSVGTRRLRSSSPPIEVVKPVKRRKEGMAPQEKGKNQQKGREMRVQRKRQVRKARRWSRIAAKGERRMRKGRWRRHRLYMGRTPSLVREIMQKQDGNLGARI
ncbi:hypothetical protein Dimus_004063 [Dionaea muscipula]